MTYRDARLGTRDTERVPFSEDELDRSIPERFARIVATRPAALAIATESERITYAELDRRSDGFATALVRQAPDRETPVAVLLSEQAAMISGMLGAWKTGKLCVPLDPALPPARLEAILRDSEAGLAITDREGAAALSTLPRAAWRQIRSEEIDLLRPVELPRASVPPDTLACLLYTSGSTGQPKGIVRSHRNVLHRARCSVRSLAVGPEDRLSALHSPSVGAGLRDLLAALLSGAALLPFDPRKAAPRALAGWIDREQISILCAVVTLFRHLLADLAPQKCFPSVRVVRLGSEPLFRTDIERFRDHFRPGTLLVAGYGASEASGIVEYRMNHDTPLPSGRVPAGYAHEGVEILVFDDDGRPVGDNEVGEVAVRSRYLSEGYWRRPDLTQATFLVDPSDSAQRIYRTGDIGRLRPDGCLELLGRRDHQVKVRGHRVHPGEVEVALAEHPDVHEAVVTGRTEPDGETHLVAYVVPRASPAPPAGELRRFLQARLPVYMVPSVFVSLESFPVTVSGKVDRLALPPPPGPAVSGDAKFVPLRSPLEHQIATIWEALFDVRPIGADADFFDLGGDSLLAAALMAAIEETCGRVLLPSVLLEVSTVAGLASRLLREESGFTEPLTAIRTSGARSPLFFVHNDGGRGLYTHGLARYLDQDRPVFAVHLHGLAERALPATVSAVATDRLQAVRAARPHGPFVLGGHCHGGLVALEMARQLRAEGERVEVVVLVDTRAPGRSLRALHRASRAVSWLYGLPPDGRAELVTEIGRLSEEFASRARYYQRRFRILGRSGSRGWAEVVRRKLEQAHRGTARVLRGHPEQGEEELAVGVANANVEPEETYRRAIRYYEPPPYPDRVALFRAEGWPARRPDLGWSKLLPRLEVAIIPGDHHTCITRHVASFGALLEQTMRRAAAES